MDAVRKIYDALPDKIATPPELRDRKVEVIIMPLDEQRTEPVAVTDGAEFFGVLPDFPDRGTQGEYEEHPDF